MVKKTKEALNIYYLQMKQIVQDTFNNDKATLEAKHALRVQKLKDILQKKLEYYDTMIAELPKTP